MIKRLGIFVFYDAFGIMDSYVEVLLESVLLEVQKLVIIVNGNITDESKCKMEKYSSNIFIRDNIGFDAGAYKDAFLVFLAEEHWNEWDEVLLLNDTFYGPVFPWDFIFQEMQREANLDFWGLTRSSVSVGTERKYSGHIQSFFLVCRKRLISHPVFWKFWETLEYPENHQMDVENFEVRFTICFMEHGFKCKTYMEMCGEIPVEYAGSIYYTKPYELLKELHIPIIKRRALGINNFERARKALAFVKQTTNYDVSRIYKHMERLAEEDRIIPFNPLKLENFYNTHRRIFIYGYGNYGKNVEAYFVYKNWRYEGFIVSEKETEDANVFVYREMDFKDGDGIVLALGKKAMEEVYPIVKQTMDCNQLFVPG